MCGDCGALGIVDFPVCHSASGRIVGQLDHRRRIAAGPWLRGSHPPDLSASLQGCVVNASFVIIYFYIGAATTMYYLYHCIIIM